MLLVCACRKSSPELAVMCVQRVEVQLKRHKEVARLAAIPPDEHAEKVCVALASGLCSLPAGWCRSRCCRG